MSSAQGVPVVQGVEVPMGQPVQRINRPSNQSVTALPARANAAIGSYTLPVRKREVRGFARLGSLGGAGLLVLHVLTFHIWIHVVWAATVMLLVVAVANLVAAFAEDLSIRSFFASMTDFGLATGAALCFLLQAAASEIHSTTLSAGMHLVALAIELFLIGIDLGASLAGATFEVNDHAS